ncbi:MAG TPA: peptidylprolyl isomerase [Pyrinomonadaceae bacterium]|nr:peptidylprolyl isomerase [Pyrinomonadaceae bacterium]
MNSNKRTISVNKIFISAVALLILLPASVYAQRTPRGRTRTRTPATKPRTAAPRTQPTATTTAPPAASQTTAINLSAKDLEYIVDGLNVPPQARAQMASSKEERGFFVEDMKQMFAVAEEARAAGLAAQPEIKLQLDLSRAFVIARAYSRKRQMAGAAKPEDVVSKEEIAAFLKEPGQDRKFAEFEQDYLRTRKGQEGPLTPAQREELMQNWANVMVNSRKGIAAGVDKERQTQVVIMYQHARLLAAAYYQQKLSTQAKATEQEIDAYVAQHPELDPKEARTKIEGLLQRVRAGEDFATLAKEFSADPGSKVQGGDLGWFGRGMMVKPFEDAAFALKPGEVSGIVESPFGFHIIKLEERRTQNGADGKPAEQVRARHILIQSGVAQGRNAAPQTPREQARAAVERQKRDALFNEILSRSNIRIAEDFRADPSQPEVQPTTSGATPPSPASTTTRQTSTQPVKPAPAQPARPRP